MSDLEFDLAASQPCPGDRALHFGLLYYVQRGSLQPPATVDIPNDFDVARPERIVDMVRLETAEQLQEDIRPDDLVAAALLRLCFKRGHNEGYARQPIRTRLERVGMYAVTASATSRNEVELARGFTGHSRSHVAAARRKDINIAVNPLVVLPTTRSERARYLVTAAVESVARGATLASQPYVALHTDRQGKPLETIVPRSKLQPRRG